MGIFRDAAWTVGLTGAAFMLMRNIAFSALVGIDAFGIEMDGDPKLAADYEDLNDQYRELELTRTLRETEITANMSQSQVDAIKEAQATFAADEDAYTKAIRGFNQTVLGRTPFAFSNPLGWGIAAALGIATRVAARERF